MTRAHRLDWAGAMHHVMNRGVDRRPIFFADEDRIEFGQRLVECHDRFGLELLAYCLMGNHYHLVARTPAGDLSAAMHHLATTFVRHTNDRLCRDGPMFRGRFTSIPVTTDSYLRQLVRYVHLNPLDIAGISRPDAYRWSSYRAYLGLRPPPVFLDMDLVLSLHDNDRKRMAEFTTAAGERPGIVPTTVDELGDVVRLAVAAEADAAQGPRERLVLASLLERVEDPRLADLIAQRLAFPSAAARRTAVSRSRARVRADAAVARVVDRLVGELGCRRVS